MTTLLQIPGADTLMEVTQNLDGDALGSQAITSAFDTANRAMEMGQVIGLVTVILLFVGIPLLIFFLARNRHRERLALIEKGLNPNPAKPENGFFKALMWGMLIGGAGLGYLIGTFLVDFLDMQGGVVFASILFFAGAGLVGYFFYRSQQEKPDNSEKP